MSAVIPFVGMEVADRYRLVGCRGRGGIGEVWEAVQSRTGRHVALKLLLPSWQTDTNVRQRFVREGRLASTMQHRHIVDILEVGETREGMPFIAMELLEGQPLHTAIERGGPLPWERVKVILLQICGALDHAHGLKIVHRDIKPSNVMLAPGQPDRCKLFDFGIAKQNLVHSTTVQHLTGEGQMLGSPGFMSPEQLRGKPTDVRGDIYGLGCTGFYLLTGTVPYEGDSVPEMIHNALYSPPRSLGALDLEEELLYEIETVVHRAVERDPERRFSSILDFVVALNGIGRGGIAPIPLRPRPAEPVPSEHTDQPSQELRTDIPDTVVDSPQVELPPADDSPVAAEAEPVVTPDPVADTANTAAVPSISGATLPIASVVTGARGLVSTQAYSDVLEDRRVVDRVSWGGAEGFVELARVASDVVVVHMSGTVASPAAWLFDSQLGILLERNRPIHLFWHLAAIETYPSDVRDASLRCLKDHSGCIESVHMLKSPRKVGMAVSLAAVALGGKSHVYDDPVAWQAALDSWASRRNGELSTQPS
ncbi:MAG: serine/threonine-protein kinase [Myxococcota bacterium]